VLDEAVSAGKPFSAPDEIFAPHLAIQKPFWQMHMPKTSPPPGHKCRIYQEYKLYHLSLDTYSSTQKPTQSQHQSDLGYPLAQGYEKPWFTFNHLSQHKQSLSERRAMAWHFPRWASYKASLYSL